MKKKLLFIINNLKNSFRKYFDFKGRASRSEFWIFTIFVTIITFIPVLIFFAIEMNYIYQGKSLLIDFDLFFTKAANESWSESEIEKQFLLVWEAKLDLYFYIIYGLSIISFIIPSVSVAFRRLHDFGKPGFYSIIYYIIAVLLGGYNNVYSNTNDYIFLGIFISIIFYVYVSQKPDSRKNKYGPVPKIIKK